MWNLQRHWNRRLERTRSTKRRRLHFEALEDRTAPAAGPLVLMGIDAEDGGSDGHGPITTYRTIIASILTAVNNSGTDILVLGGGKSPNDHVTEFWNAIDDLIPIASVVFANGSDLATVPFQGKAMIAVVSDFLNTPSGGLTNAENDLLATRQVDFASFVDGGGGLLGFSSVGLTEPYPYLRQLGSFTFGHPPQFDDITPTPAGLEVGITDLLDVCCWHDEYLTFPGFLAVLATNVDTGNPVALGGRLGGSVSSDAGGPYDVNEGGSVQLSGSGTGNGITFTWDLDGDDNFGETGAGAANGDEVGQNPVFSAANLDGPLSLTVSLRVTNEQGQSADSDATVSVHNVAPIGRLFNNGPVDEGKPAVVRFGDQFDPSMADTTAGFHFAFDTNNDGVFDIGDGTYAGSGTSASTLIRGRLLMDGPGSRVVKARIIDKDGDFTDRTTTIVIKNVKPVVTTVATDSPGCGGAAENQTVTLSGAFTDAGVLDTHTATIFWGDGTSSAGTVNQAGGSGTVSGSHAYADGGTYVITLVVTDKDGDANSKDVGVFVTGAGISGSTLRVIGTNNPDEVEISEHALGTQYKVQADFLPSGFKTFSSAGVTEIVVVLCDENDVAQIEGAVLATALIDGGAGNDDLKGGGGANVILGGSGDDTMTAGAVDDDGTCSGDECGGRNVLIGGAGVDAISGKGGEDLLIAGITAFDSEYTALFSILSEWSRSDQTYEQRVDHLRGDVGGGHNGSNHLTASTVSDDSDADQLSGNAGRDWFFVRLSGPVNDVITDLDANEFVDAI
jgi:hypothetical protein